MTKKKKQELTEPEIILEIAGEKVPVTWREIPEDLEDLAQCITEIDGTHRIVMSLQIPPRQEWDILLHEIFHAICSIYHVKFILEDENVNAQREENLSDIFGEGFSQALAPWLPKRPRKARRSSAKIKTIKTETADLETVKGKNENASSKKV